MTDEYTPEHSAPAKTHPLLSNATYDRMKQFNQLILPALGTLYVTLATQWPLPQPDAVAASILAFSTFLGVVLNFATRAYNNSEAKFDGQLNVIESEGQKTMQLELNAGPEVLENQDQVAFRVVKQ